MRVTVLLTAFNRREETLRCLERLEAQGRDAGARLSVVLVDDGSTDGTTAAVEARFPSVRLVAGSGELYWNGGMRLAFETAAPDDPDYFLLLNDDTHLLPGALTSMLATHRRIEAQEGRPCLVAGATRDPHTGRQSYGGLRRGGWLTPGRIRLIPPGEVVQRCDTVNGNCVLVSREVFRRVGLLDVAFTHVMGDLDYGFRAGLRGCVVVVAPGYVGECAANPGLGSWAKGRYGFLERWRRLVGPKGLPPREWLTFTSRHFGPLWVASFVWPYLKCIWLGLLRR